jgi:hypothetical protein
MTRAERRRKNHWMLGEVAKLRKGLKMARDNPALPHVIQMPDGTKIDILDGETEKLLDQMEQVALLGLATTKATTC